MPRLILKCPYLKGGKAAAHLSYLVKYIATREGVERIPDSRRLLPATPKQRDLLEQIVRDFPDTKSLFEYEDYLAAPTVENASDFIGIALELNFEQLAKRENYVDYIANRPRVQKLGTHGLFWAGDDPLVLSNIADEVAQHAGNVWTPIISLRREDGARIGFDNAENWRDLLMAKSAEIADSLKISPDHFRWYAAFHNESHHPHIHMICYSIDPREGFLTRHGIAQMKSGLARQIFRQALNTVYAEQTKRRDALGMEAREVMERLVRQMQNGILYNEKIEQLTAYLADRLQYHSGKKQYGYLKAPLKSVVDEIVDELAKDSRVAEAYRLWYEMRNEVLNTYRDELPEMLPLSKQKEFKSIRNMVIKEALLISDRTMTFEEPASVDTVLPEPESEDDTPPDNPLPEDETSEPEYDSREQTRRQGSSRGRGSSASWWTEDYKLAKKYLFGDEDAGIPRDFSEARALFLSEAENDNPLAMYDLGRMSADGLGREADAEEAQRWYAEALAGFHAAQKKRPWEYTEYRIGKMYAAGLGTEQDQGYAFRLYARAAAQDFPYASFELGKMLRDGIGCVKNSAESERHFRDAFHGFVSLEEQSHDDKIQYRLGWMLLNGVGTEKNVTRAKEMLEKLAGVGNPFACYQLAKLILTEPNPTPDEVEKALAFLKQAVEAENPYAAYFLGKLCQEGRHVPQNIAEAARFFRLSAEQGNEYAAYRLGKLYLGGEGVLKDVSEALHWLNFAADKKNQFAEYALGVLYLKGEDIPKDTATGVEYLKRSASRGNQFAQYRLGKIYLAGEDAPKDVEAALRYLHDAAEQGNQYAQYTLGKLYLMGRDVSRNMESAVRWLTLSAAQGNQYAQFFLDNLDRFRNPSVFLAATRMLHHMSRIFADNTPAGKRGAGIQLDRKLLRKLKTKKIAQGHKADDHEQEQTPGMTMTM